MSNTHQTPITLERILDAENIMRAIKQVQSNKGAPGVDGMTTSELKAYCLQNPYKISNEVRLGKYKPQPILRVYIPKDNGEKRPLGIPTVIDRVVQQATAQVLSVEYEKVFSDNSFGFRPNRGCKDAIAKAVEYLNQGYTWIIDLDLSKFFDTVNHSKLLQLLSDKIKDGRVVSLIHKFLKAPVCEDGKVGKATVIGTPQGGCISPILANIILNELDQFLDNRGIKFVRYADDMMILTTSKRSAERILKTVTEFIEKRLFLKVNQTKTKIGPASPEMQFLGFGFTNEMNDSLKKTNPSQIWFPIIHQKKVTKFKTTVRAATDRRAKGGLKTVCDKLKMKIRGWTNYFREGLDASIINRLDGWLRRRIRQLLWKNWKTAGNRYNQFKALWPQAPGLEQYPYSNGNYWHMSKTEIIHRALTNANLKKLGWSWVGQFV